MSQPAPDESESTESSAGARPVLAEHVSAGLSEPSIIGEQQDGPSVWDDTHSQSSSRQHRRSVRPVAAGSTMTDRNHSPRPSARKREAQPSSDEFHADAHEEIDIGQLEPDAGYGRPGFRIVKVESRSAGSGHILR